MGAETRRGLLTFCILLPRQIPSEYESAKAFESAFKGIATNCTDGPELLLNTIRSHWGEPCAKKLNQCLRPTERPRPRMNAKCRPFMPSALSPHGPPEGVSHKAVGGAVRGITTD